MRREPREVAVLGNLLDASSRGAAVIRELLEMVAATGEKMRFGGVGSKLKVTSSSSLFCFTQPLVFLKLLCEQCRS